MEGREIPADHGSAEVLRPDASTPSWRRNWPISASAIKTECKEDRKGNVKYYSWDIEGIPDSLVAKTSRRSRRKSTRPKRRSLAKLKEAARRVCPRSACRRSSGTSSGRTSRRVKRDDLTLEECREYWASRDRRRRKADVAETIRRAKLGLNPRPENRLARAVAFSMRHHFEKESALPVEELVITALEHGMGSATPEDVERELKRQGVIIVEKDGQRLATTEALMRERNGGWPPSPWTAGAACRPIGVADGLARQLCSGETLTDGQWDAVLGLLRSDNRVNAVAGPGRGRQVEAARKFDEGMKLAGQQVTYLGTTSTAVKVLKKDGFEDTQTLARFLLDDKDAGGRPRRPGRRR